MKKVSKVITAISVITSFFLFLTPVLAQDEGVPERGQSGTITVLTNPEKATIYLGGDELGLTPIEDLTVPSGRHDITIMLGGEELINERVNIWPGKLTTLERELVLPYGTVVVKTSPGYTKIKIDGVDVGRTEGGPLTINNVESGDHVVSASAKGRRTRKIDVSIQGQDTVQVELNLKRR